MNNLMTCLNYHTNRVKEQKKREKGHQLFRTKVNCSAASLRPPPHSILESAAASLKLYIKVYTATLSCHDGVNVFLISFPTQSVLFV